MSFTAFFMIDPSKSLKVPLRGTFKLSFGFVCDMIDSSKTY
jgi:hypothetical protein